jgi:FkbM family methyltransferase
MSRVKAKRTPRGVRQISTGVGVGLAFDPGPSNPAYGVGDNERPVQDAFAGHLHIGDVLYDIGANVGFFTVIGAKLVGPSGHVYAFEPVPGNAELVRRNAERNGFANVTVVEKAVSAESGQGELVLAEYSGGAALSTAAPPPDATVTVPVEMVTVDDCVSSGELLAPAAVKIDVEGAELEVLHGMAATIRDHGPIIICEIDDANQSGYDAKYTTCVDYVRSFGYEVKQLADSYVGGAWLVGHFVATPPAGSHAEPS